MGNSLRSPARRRRALSHNHLHSNVLSVHLAPPAPRSSHAANTISCQAGSQLFAEAPMEPLESPKSEPYSGSLQSLVSSANVSNINLAPYPNSSQHIDSQVISNFISGILVQAEPQKEQPKTEYSEGKEPEDNLSMTK